MRLYVGPDNHQVELLDHATEAWRVFCQAIGDDIPFEASRVYFQESARPANGIAACRYFTNGDPRRESCWILMSRSFFHLPERRRYLTLLHECIHLRFLMGSMRDRAVELDELERDHCPANAGDANEQQFYEHRLHLAFWYRSFVDEIVAELHLKAHYQAYLRERIVYYLEMRRGSFAKREQDTVAPSLKPHTVLFEILRNELGVLFAEGHPEAAEFTNMARELGGELRRLCTEAELVSHMETKRRLLLVSLEPLTYDREIYGTIFQSIISLCNT
jgi:hypothetical protein